MMMVTAAKDEWVRAAMTDDSVVVELLVRLKQSQVQSVVKSAAVAVAALRWGIRQPRTRLSSSSVSASMRCDDMVSRGKGGGDSANSSLMRASPTTPLSWSGGGAVSPSATADAFEETSRQQTSSGARSKGIAANETTSNVTKRSRRKKTVAELKEEEGLLLKERIHLKKEIETLRATYKEHSTVNVNLKRMKLDLEVHSAKNPSEAASDDTQNTISDQVHKVVTKSSLPSVGAVPLSESCESHKAASTRSSVCLLPDLNILPSEDDSGSETLYGMS